MRVVPTVATICAVAGFANACGTSDEARHESFDASVEAAPDGGDAFDSRTEAEAAADAAEGSVDANLPWKFCEPVSGAPDRALVASVISDNPSDPDAIVVYTLTSGGKIIDHGISIGG